MPAATITPRLIALEDLNTTTLPAGEAYSAEVLGAGTTTLHKLALVLLTQFGQYASDSAAAAGGVALGEIYYQTGANKLHARLA